MTYDKKALLLFEGQTDKKQFFHLSKTFSSLLREGGYEAVVFQTSIYELYEPLLCSGEFDCLASFLLSKRMITCPFGTRPQDMFSLIYLVFDFDPLYHLFDLNKINKLQQYFSDETKNGLLYINYPMVEALFDFKKVANRFVITNEVSKDLCSSAAYKDYIRNITPFVSERSNHPFHYLPPKPFALVSLLSIDRYYEILGRKKETAWSFSDSESILKKEEQALEQGKIYPLSCFPFMALDYNAELAMKTWLTYAK